MTISVLEEAEMNKNDMGLLQATADILEKAGIVENEKRRI